MPLQAYSRFRRGAIYCTLSLKLHIFGECDCPSCGANPTIRQHYYERPDLHTLQNRSGELWQPLRQQNFQLGKSVCAAIIKP